MTTKTTTLVLTTCLALAGASSVSAQVAAATAARGFVNVNVGAQPGRDTLTTGGSFSIHGETGSFSSEQSVKNGPFFDISGGVKAWQQLSIGAGYSSFSSQRPAGVTASIPHPLFFNQPGTSTVVTPDLKRTERGVHIMAVWLIPVTSKIDVALSGGPSFIQVKQEFVSSVTVPAGTQTFTPVLSSESGTAKGVNVGFDGTYMFSRNFGAGLLIRYAGGGVDLPSLKDVKAGRFQGGIGARLRF